LRQPACSGDLGLGELGELRFLEGSCAAVGRFARLDEDALDLRFGNALKEIRGSGRKPVVHVDM
jgi:hypothetical protein